jgi:Ca2+/Na+ antiporter
MDSGTIGAIAGVIIGVLGGLIGSYLSISNAKTKKERIYMVKAVGMCWAVVIAFLLLVIFLPEPINSFIWIPYLAGLFALIRYWNKKLKQMQVSEER